MKNRSAKPLNKKFSIAKLFAVEDEELRIWLIFLLRFALLYIAFEICYFIPSIYDHAFMPVNHFFAYTGAKVLTLFGYKASSTIDSINSPEFSESIKRGCDSMEALAIFICGVIAFPSTLKMKGWGLLAGTFIICFFNLIRVVHLFWIGVHHRDLFDLFHLEIWQFYFIAQSIILWLVWMRRAILSN